MSPKLSPAEGQRLVHCEAGWLRVVAVHLLHFMNQFRNSRGCCRNRQPLCAALFPVFRTSSNQVWTRLLITPGPAALSDACAVSAALRGPDVPPRLDPTPLLIVESAARVAGAAVAPAHATDALRIFGSATTGPMTHLAQHHGSAPALLSRSGLQHPPGGWTLLAESVDNGSGGYIGVNRG